jgi:hypothetical protein
MKVIINRGQSFGTIDGVITETEKIYKLINVHLKAGTARLIVDNNETLMYSILQKV